MTIIITLFKAIGILSVYFCLVGLVSRLFGLSNDRERDVDVLIDRRVD